ncbi:hypothetical protein [uncultured Campylobacter sp.]|uniref:hypothetical protein n=1 Tax=uncultured Campylobacter sp. TaxID=218934 RepID=UPI002637EEC0|nr:hypothetical protein [uncultured Campylobacter sp.]
MKFIAYYDSPLGKITLAGDGAGLCGLWFEGEKYYAHALAASGADKKYNASDFAAKDAGKKPRAINLSAQGTGEKILRKRAKRILRGEKPGCFRSN